VPDHGLDPRRRIRHARRIAGFFRTKAFDEFRRYLGKNCFSLVLLLLLVVLSDVVVVVVGFIV
jgi:hypothetical protein